LNFEIEKSEVMPQPAARELLEIYQPPSVTDVTENTTKMLDKYLLKPAPRSCNLQLPRLTSRRRTDPRQPNHLAHNTSSEICGETMSLSSFVVSRPSAA
jgi:hypothetical protein